MLDEEAMIHTQHTWQESCRDLFHGSSNCQHSISIRDWWWYRVWHLTLTAVTSVCFSSLASTLFSTSTTAMTLNPPLSLLFSSSQCSSQRQALGGQGLLTSNTCDGLAVEGCYLSVSVDSWWLRLPKKECYFLCSFSFYFYIQESYKVI